MRHNLFGRFVPTSPSAPRNRLLASLSADDLARLAPALERVELDTKQVVFDVDRPIEHVVFPEAAVVSILSVMADGSAIETATVGHEGMVGLPVFLGTDQMSAQAFCQIPGPALRVRSDDFRGSLEGSRSLTLVLQRYTQALFLFVAQSSACNRLHSMPQRCARWLLHTHDRVGADVGRDDFPLTHQFLSQMLGVRRATVTECMRALQKAGAVSYVRGRVVVRDRAMLERAACECYVVIGREFDRLIGTTTLARAATSPLDDVKTSAHGRSTLGEGVSRAPERAASRNHDDLRTR
jgi:CRP-like cAMP-binding protein